MSKKYFADGVQYDSLRTLAEEIGVQYKTVAIRFKQRPFFFLNGRFLTSSPPAKHETERQIAEKLVWKKSKMEHGSVRFIGSKLAPLLGPGYVTHGINDRFGH